MTAIDEEISPPARIAEPDEGISLDELRLATRNHGMPLEMLDLRPHPAGPALRPDPLRHPARWTRRRGGWRSTGRVEHPVSLDLAELLGVPDGHPRGDAGVRRERPRPHSSRGRSASPGSTEAVGTAEWTGTPLAPLLEEAGLSPGAVDVVFTGADHGVERGVEQDYARGAPADRGAAAGDAAPWAMNGAPLPPQHGAPLRLLVPGWYGMTQVKWLADRPSSTEPFTGYQNATAYRLKVRRGRGRRAGDPHPPASPCSRRPAGRTS